MSSTSQVVILNLSNCNPKEEAGFRTSAGLDCSETRGLDSSCVSLIFLPGSDSRYRIVIIATWASTVLIHMGSPVLPRMRSTSLINRCQSAATISWLVTLRDSSLFARRPTISASEGNIRPVTEKMKRTVPLVVAETNVSSCLCQQSVALHQPCISICLRWSVWESDINRND